jgi:hypothetical protein
MNRFPMPRSSTRSLRRGLPLLLTACALCSSCYDTGWGGSRTTFAASYGTGFYRPFGYNYGAWGPNYWVGPPRGGFGRPPLSARGWRGRGGVPSIPMRPRGPRFGAGPGWRGRRF